MVLLEVVLARLFTPEWGPTAAHCVRNDAGYSVNVILDIIIQEDMYKIDAKRNSKPIHTYMRVMILISHRTTLLF